jgi:hypothetical protein
MVIIVFDNVKSNFHFAGRPLRSFSAQYYRYLFLETYSCAQAS